MLYIHEHACIEQPPSSSTLVFEFLLELIFGFIGLAYFLVNEWIFSTKNSEWLIENFSFTSNPSEKITIVFKQDIQIRKDLNSFNFDWKMIDWHDYLNYFCYGIQRFHLGMCSVLEVSPLRILFNLWTCQ